MRYKATYGDKQREKQKVRKLEATRNTQEEPQKKDEGHESTATRDVPNSKDETAA